ncbi:hypothetical protein RB620_06500 [Paenibacillus sp. LHD-117]|uniref:hypothetical protein n=1 Tax=Paenibacillus sp. LHD-117 TaxID=3071412 RepID=UPI0027E057F7|nr:hypothetical protein [Paenibacillus sp. LHD-117]MDQ6419086.1 hypothetical protein [Paenibacillus sp. LHD-117]
MNRVFHNDNDLLDSSIEALDSNNGVEERITIPVTFGEASTVTVQVPASALLEAAANLSGLAITIDAGQASYDLPLGAIDFAAVAEELSVDTGDMSITITMNFVTGDLSEQVEVAADQNGMQVVGGAIDFTVTVGANGRSAEIDSFGGTYVTRSLTIDGAVNERQTSVLLFDPNTGELRFVPEVFSTVNGKTEVTFMRRAKRKLARSRSRCSSSTMSNSSMIGCAAPLRGSLKRRS